MFCDDLVKLFSWEANTHGASIPFSPVVPILRLNFFLRIESVAHYVRIQFPASLPHFLGSGEKKKFS